MGDFDFCAGFASDSSDDVVLPHQLVDFCGDFELEGDAIVCVQKAQPSIESIRSKPSGAQPKAKARFRGSRGGMSFGMRLRAAKDMSGRRKDE